MAPEVSPPAQMKCRTPSSTRARRASSASRPSIRRPNSRAARPAASARWSDSSRSAGASDEATRTAPCSASARCTRGSNSRAMSAGSWLRSARPPTCSTASPLASAAATCPSVCSAQLPARASTGADAGRDRSFCTPCRRPRSPSRRQIAGSSIANADEPEMNGRSATARAIVRTSRWSRQSTTTCGVPECQSRSRRLRTARGPSRTASCSNSPTHRGVCCCSHRTRFASVIGLSGWLRMGDSLSGTPRTKW